MRYLFGVTGTPLPDSIERNNIIDDIVNNWKPNYNLFSISQISERNGVKRQKVRRIVKRLIKAGIIEEHNAIKG